MRKFMAQRLQQGLEPSRVTTLDEEGVGILVRGEEYAASGDALRLEKMS
jgi:hypothetical protein